MCLLRNRMKKNIFLSDFFSLLKKCINNNVLGASLSPEEGPYVI